ncbi:RagB/SusD family nutrient uptake outer membrane protein [Ancylomarina sp. DW003]|nr:RagB/SusD family nutrient uptake outer membrane protein [Ancylomarina sp. DW003]MDE5422718.1 RagB/SusD family nutrient uptake outer membrane protein [Ancylomarina sp. DW003]
MRKLYILLLLFLSSLVMSCDDYLDVQPKNVLSVQNVDELKMLIGSYMKKVEQGDIGATGYHVFKPMGLYGQNIFREYEDDLDFTNLFSTNLKWFERYTIKWQYAYVTDLIWTGMYTNIGDFNLFVYEINRVGDNSDGINVMEAEVLMSRAYYYLKLAQYFCPYRAVPEYGITDPERYGLPIMKSVEALSEDSFADRLSQKETYDFILNDLKALEELDIDPSDFNIIYNRRAMYGLMAEFYMWRAESPAGEPDDWENARICAEKSIAGTALVETQNDLQKVFNPAEGSSTSALRVTTPIKTETDGYEFYYHSDLGDDIYVRDIVFDLYDDNDIRRDFYISGIPGLRQLEKFGLADDAGRTVQSLWRVADMKLIIAESYVREGDPGNARVHLNEVKQSRIPGFVSYGGDDVLDEIVRERRKEFLCESNYRWLDMKRLGLTYTRTSTGGDSYTLLPDDFRYSFRIPEDAEILHNPNCFQNPGWDFISENE